jgi:hypothetical protein
VTFRSVATAPPRTNLRARSDALPIWLAFIYVGALACVEWLVAVSVPAAAVGFGLLPLSLSRAPAATEREQPCAVGRASRDTGRATCRGGHANRGCDAAHSPGTAAVPTWIVVGLTARSCPPAWRSLHPGFGGWRALAAVAGTGIPLGVVVYLVARPTS